MKLGATRSHKRWQWEPKASGIVDAPQTLPWQQGLGWRAGMRSGLAVPSMSPRLALVAVEQWQGGSHRGTGLVSPPHPHSLAP